ncbi:MAG: DUF4113 domain-containing protein, partial [Magnetococcus sp. WYHC-3]
MTPSGRDRFCRDLRARVRRWTGIPVSVGLAPTKTLAKVANRLAKKSPRTGGVLDLENPRWRERALAGLPVEEVWGVGRRLAWRLAELGIRTAAQLRDAPAAQIRRHFNVVLERTVRELRGEAVLALAEQPPARQSITCSRTFGSQVTALEALLEAVSTFTVGSAERLRRYGLLATAMQVFIQTNRHSVRDPQYQNAITLALPQASDDTFTLLEHARAALVAIYRAGFRYQKAGVWLLGLVPRQRFQPSLFAPPPRVRQAPALMRTLDRINSDMGRGTIRFGAEGLAAPSWGLRQQRRSPGYTTRWSDIPAVRD